MSNNMTPQPYPLWASWRTETDGSAIVERGSVLIEHHHARVIGWWTPGRAGSSPVVWWRGRARDLGTDRGNGVVELDIALYDTEHEAAAAAAVGASR